MERLCSLCGNTTTKQVPPEGIRDPQIAFVGEAPAFEEVSQGRPFVGASGTLLRGVLKDLHLDGSIYITNVTKCFHAPTDRPAANHLKFCEQLLLAELEEIRPKVVVALGKTASAALGVTGRRGVGEIGAGGWRVLNTYHPAFVLRKKPAMPLWIEDMALLRDMVSSIGRVPTPPRYLGGMSGANIASWLDIIRARGKVVAFDVECYPLSPYERESVLYTVQFTVLLDLDSVSGEMVTFVCPVAEELGGNEDIRNFVREVSLSNIPKVGFNAFFDMAWIRAKLGAKLQNLHFDSQIASHLFDENVKLTLKNLSVLYTDFGPYGDAIERYKKTGIGRAPREMLIKYGACDTEATMWSYLAQREATFSKFGHVYRTLLMPGNEALVDLKHSGAKYDWGYASRQDKQMALKQDALYRELKTTPEVSGALKRVATDRWEKLREKAAVATADKKVSVPKSPKPVEFLLGSPDQIRAILKEFGIKISRKTKKAQEMSTAADDLAPYKAHPFVGKLLEWKKVDKLRSTYLTPYVKPSLDGFIHANFNIIGARTGRLSSSDPNLQNIPRGPVIKRMFISRYGQDGRLIEADYGQLEIRILAWYSHDARLIEIINSGEDLHASVGSVLIHKPIGEITKDERTFIKTLHFGIVYGMSAETLAVKTGRSVQEAQAFIDEYFLKFQGAKRWIDDIIKSANTSLFVDSLYGRRKILYDMLDDTAEKQGHARNAAINFPIQGLASDLTLLAFCTINDVLRQANIQAAPVTIVHDSIVLDCHKDYTKRVVGLVWDVMTNLEKFAPWVSVWKLTKLEADFKMGKTWGDLHEINFLTKV